MFKILVADDERFIRKGIISILVKNLSGDVVCVEASNGLEALDCAQRERPNLIITDISMPGMSGLEFIAKLKEQQVKTEVVILTGYENFEYAKRAVKLGVKEYVMKPIKKKEFIELMQGYVSDIQTMQTKSDVENMRRIENERIMRQLKQDFLIGLLKCDTNEEAKQFLNQLKEMGMIFESKLYICAVVQYRITSQNHDYVDFAVKNIIDEYLTLESSEFLETVTYRPGELAIIFQGNSRESLRGSKKKLMRRAVQLIQAYCKADAYAGIGDVAYDAIRLHTALNNAVLAADYKIFEGGDSVTVYEELPRREKKTVSKLAKKYKNLEKTDMFELLSAFQNIYQDAKPVKDVEALKIEYIELQKLCSIQSPFSCYWTFGELKKELKERLEMLEASGEETKLSNTNMMNQVRRYVDEHLTEDLDLNMVAERFHRTPGYISTLFKRYVEGGFNYYLTKERIEIAKKLLEDSSVSIQEVGELCGYNNPKYFSVVFKKITGDTPSWYRERFSR